MNLLVLIQVPGEKSTYWQSIHLWSSVSGQGEADRDSQYKFTHSASVLCTFWGRGEGREVRRVSEKGTCWELGKCSPRAPPSAHPGHFVIKYLISCCYNRAERKALRTVSAL